MLSRPQFHHPLMDRSEGRPPVTPAVRQIVAPAGLAAVKAETPGRCYRRMDSRSRALWDSRSSYGSRSRDNRNGPRMLHRGDVAARGQQTERTGRSRPCRFQFAIIFIELFHIPEIEQFCTATIADESYCGRAPKAAYAQAMVTESSVALAPKIGGVANDIFRIYARRYADKCMARMP